MNWRSATSLSARALRSSSFCRSRSSWWPALWNCSYFLRIRFRLWKSYGSGSGSNFWKVMVPIPVPSFEKLWFRFQLLKSYGSGSYFWKVTVPVPVQASYLDHKKLILLKKNLGNFFAFLLILDFRTLTAWSLKTEAVLQIRIHDDILPKNL